jgi:hypothetical protein
MSYRERSWSLRWRRTAHEGTKLSASRPPASTPRSIPQRVRKRTESRRCRRYARRRLSEESILHPGLKAMNKAASPHVVQRIRAEYLEMPGLTLKPAQIQRLCGVERSVCETALASLVETGFLSMRPDGAYGRFPRRRASSPASCRRCPSSVARAPASGVLSCLFEWSAPTTQGVVS